MLGNEACGWPAGKNHRSLWLGALFCQGLPSSRASTALIGRKREAGEWYSGLGFSLFQARQASRVVSGEVNDGNKRLALFSLCVLSTTYYRGGFIRDDSSKQMANPPITRLATEIFLIAGPCPPAPRVISSLLFLACWMGGRVAECVGRLRTKIYRLTDHKDIGAPSLRASNWPRYSTADLTSEITKVCHTSASI